MCNLCGRPGLVHEAGGHNNTFYFDDGLDDGYPRADAAGTTTGSSSSTQPVGTLAQLADYEVNGYWQWKGQVAHHWASNTITVNLTDLTAAEQTIARAALALWHDVANITFVETTGSANITFNNNGSMTASTSGSWSSSGIMSSATVDISSDWVTNYGTSLGSYSYQTYIHEIGHALGLGHQGPYNGSATYGTNNIYANDTWQYSVMSYFAESNYGGASYRFVSTPQMADIYAITSIYGASTTTRTGDTVYGFNSNAGATFNFTSYGGAPALTIYDSGGTDTLDCSGYSQSQVINLTGGSFSNIGGLVGNIGIYTTSVIENAIGGSGSDTITGNAAANRITGGGGNDTLNGGAGNDTAVYAGLSTSYRLVQNADGSWTVTDLRSGAPDGTDTLTGIEFVQFSNTTVALSGQPIVVPPPSVTTFSPDTGTPGDGTTKAAVLILTGSAAASSTVTLYDDAGSLGTTTADGNGAWSFTTAALVDGGHSFTATAADGSGNTSAVSAALAVTVDTVAPTAPVIASDIINADNSVTLAGTAEAKSMVSVYDNAVLVGTTMADVTGAWSYTTGPLTSGTQELIATATDAAGNTGANSLPVDPIIGGGAPGPAPALEPVITGIVKGNGSSVMIQGTGDAGALLSIYDNSSTTALASVTVAANGTWSVTTSLSTNLVHSLMATEANSAAQTGQAPGVAIWGTDKINQLTGTAGDDLFYGRGGADTFNLTGAPGNDVIQDFTATGRNHDVIQLNKSALASYDAVLAAAAQVGSDVVIAIDATDSVTLKNVQLSNLHSYDFLLV